MAVIIKRRLIMITKIGINGFGRIGRLVARIALLRDDVEIVGINDPFMTPEYAAYLLSLDSVHGEFEKSVTFKGNYIICGSQKIPFFAEREPKDIPWGKLGCEIVIEASGKFRSSSDTSAHLTAGAKRVIITSPAKSDDIHTIVMGVNHQSLKKDMAIVSNASCTTNGLAPVVKVLEDNFGIEEGLMTTIHSVTASQLVVDGSAKNWRIGRAANENIIPYSTGAATVIGNIIPSLKGKLTGMSFRVPTINVSCIDLTVRLKKPTTYGDICAAMLKASKHELKGILGYENRPVVSKDFNGDPRSSIFDETAGIMLNNRFVKVVAWYDNEWGYSNRVIDLARYMKTMIK